MQYILSELEYSKLRSEATQHKLESTQELQDLCTLVARHAPATRPWDESKMPWGCLLDDDANYCDCCPAERMCPYEHKEYSK